ncbi:hypothetical protein [Mycolicibacterium sp.]
MPLPGSQVAVRVVCEFLDFTDGVVEDLDDFWGVQGLSASP